HPEIVDLRLFVNTNLCPHETIEQYPKGRTVRSNCAVIHKVMDQTAGKYARSTVNIDIRLSGCAREDGINQYNPLGFRAAKGFNQADHALNMVTA
ncbi:MAG: hypothetical protein IAE83_05000, partial [Anaerolinea sp.]|nr:hypothetical protein [Anaerolinea sp.]